MRKFGLVGRSLGHSFSKPFFEKLFIAQSIDASYENIEIQTIDECISIFERQFSGLNVTIPYKEQIIPFLDELTNEAEKIGAVNTIQFKHGKRIGHNTDAYGFHNSIKPFLTNQHERALIFGTGGASKAVEFVLKSLGVDVIFISRTPKGENCFDYNEINERMISACKLLVNCTPVGTFPSVNEAITLPYDALTKDHLVVDLVYNPAKTKFLEKAEYNGAMILNGESMLRHQALKAWEIWNSTDE